MRKLFLATYAFAALLIAGCGSDGSTAPTPTSIAGTWNLTSVNGAALPFVVQAANPKLEILSEQLVLNTNGTFTQTAQVRITEGTAVTNQAIADAGTWTLSGTAATFVWNDGSTGTATVSGNKFTVGEDGFSFVFTKQ
jgi:hypothetical protein